MAPQHPLQPLYNIIVGKGGVAAVFVALCGVVLFCGWKIAVSISPAASLPQSQEVQVEEPVKPARIKLEDCIIKGPVQVKMQEASSKHNKVALIWSVPLSNTCGRPLAPFDYTLISRQKSGVMLNSYHLEVPGNVLAEGEGVVQHGIILERSEAERVSTVEIAFNSGRHIGFVKVFAPVHGHVYPSKQRQTQVPIPTKADIQRQLEEYRAGLKNPTTQTPEIEHRSKAFEKFQKAVEAAREKGEVKQSSQPQENPAPASPSNLP